MWWGCTPRINIMIICRGDDERGDEMKMKMKMMNAEEGGGEHAAETNAHVDP